MERMWERSGLLESESALVCRMGLWGGVGCCTICLLEYRGANPLLAAISARRINPFGPVIVGYAVVGWDL